MKPLISYYGGKQRMANKIIPLIPSHTVYVEPFAGGAAVLFMKPWPKVTNNNHYREVINDIDGDIINFYQQLRGNGGDLCRLIGLTPYSRAEHKSSKDLECDDLERARRYFTRMQQSFSNIPHGSWAVATFGPNHAATWVNKVARLPEYLDRMASIYISNTDSLECIEQWDSPQTFFYCDPPYPGADQGHYAGYTLEMYQLLIDKLDTIDGSFLLSNYECGAKIPDSWERFEFSASSSAARDKSLDKSLDKKRTEIVYRHISTVPVRPEIQKLYDSGKFDCFTGKKVVKRVPIIEPIKREQIRCNHA